MPAPNRCDDSGDLGPADIPEDEADDGLIDYHIGTPEEISAAEAKLEAAEASGDGSGYVLAFYRLKALLPSEQVTVEWITARRPYVPGIFQRWPIEFHAGKYGEGRPWRNRHRRYWPNKHNDRIDPHD